MVDQNNYLDSEYEILTRKQSIREQQFRGICPTQTLIDSLDPALELEDYVRNTVISELNGVIRPKISDSTIDKYFRVIENDLLLKEKGLARDVLNYINNLGNQKTSEINLSGIRENLDYILQVFESS